MKPTAARCFSWPLPCGICCDIPHLLIIYPYLPWILMFEGFASRVPNQITSGISPVPAGLFLKCHRPCRVLSVELVAVPVALDPVGNSQNLLVLSCDIPSCGDKAALAKTRDEG